MFKIGQKIVCIDVSLKSSNIRLGEKEALSKLELDKIYTVKQIVRSIDGHIIIGDIICEEALMDHVVY